MAVLFFHSKFYSLTKSFLFQRSF